MNRAYYSAPIDVFRKQDPLRILGELADQSEFDLDELQKYAWRKEIEFLIHSLQDIDGQIYFEFIIPRIGKRVDVILFIKGIVFVLEFKIGASEHPKYALDQVLDYALDLKNFHQTSHKLPIVPILVTSNSKTTKCEITSYPDGIYATIKANADTLTYCLNNCIQNIPHALVEAKDWEEGQYKPTPTIVEAAQALYRGHNVQDISRSDAGAINLSETTSCIDRIIEKAKQNQRKAICFITGVPGSGKTLAGLNIANRYFETEQVEHAVFLSGNGPLVIVLQEALARDETRKGTSKREALRKTKEFIQNIHQFRDNYFRESNAPPERVIVFDEAQRAWTDEKLTDFMARKRGYPHFKMSEPEFLISVMNRHREWAVIVCLIGGGQEIYTGEAGLTEWFSSLQNHFPDWIVYVSSQITDFEYLQGKVPSDLLTNNQIYSENNLHLAVSMRSFRSEKVSAFIKAILDCDLVSANSLYQQIGTDYPIYITRNFQTAKDWLRGKARGTERYGIVASSGALRLKPEGIFVKADIEVQHWFLDGREDVRSSYALEGVATEFDIQGLELDWVGVAWDADLRYINGNWEYLSFRGSQWQRIKSPTRQLYLKNSYRVLLTRARQGMIIFIPPGDEWDKTRLPDFYNGTFDFMRKMGLSVI